MAVQTDASPATRSDRVSNAVIDSDGHVQEQLDLPPEFMMEIMERLGADMNALSAATDPVPSECDGEHRCSTLRALWIRTRRHATVATCNTTPSTQRSTTLP